MRQMAVMAVVALIGLAVVGCASTTPESTTVVGGGLSTPESVMGELLSTMKDFNVELAKIKTADDLKAAEGKFKQFIERMNAIKDIGDKLGMEDMSREQEEALEAKFKDTMEPVMKDMMSNMMRLGMLAQSDPEAKKVFDLLGDMME